MVNSRQITPINSRIVHDLSNYFSKKMCHIHNFIILNNLFLINQCYNIFICFLLLTLNYDYVKISVFYIWRRLYIALFLTVEIAIICISKHWHLKYLISIGSLSFHVYNGFGENGIKFNLFIIWPIILGRLHVYFKCNCMGNIVDCRLVNISVNYTIVTVHQYNAIGPMLDLYCWCQVNTKLSLL